MAITIEPGISIGNGISIGDSVANLPAQHCLLINLAQW
jgi:hypothetical protein